MSSCLSGGGGRTYRFDFEFPKATSTSTRTSQSSSSPSSTISESSHSPLAISTRKARTPRKRPNQIYNEAAALLSTAYPKIFPTKGLTTKPRKFTKPTDTLFFDDSPEMLLPFRVIESSGFLLHQPIQDKPSFQIESKIVNLPEKQCHSPGEIISGVNSLELGNDCDEDFDAESILDEEVEEGIDSIMGNRADDDSNAAFCQVNSSWYGNTVMGFGLGGKFDHGLGFRRSAVSALRNVDDGNWWRFPTVDIRQISPKLDKTSPLSSAEKKKKQKKVEKPKPKPDNDMASELDLELSKQNSNSSGLQLNLDYNGILKAWSGRGSPFSDESIGSQARGNDITAWLAQIDLLLDSGGVREASVMRYKEKRRTRLFSKKIRYQVRKVNADQRPRMKGRFVRRTNSNTSSKRIDKKANAKEHSLRDILLFH